MGGLIIYFFTYTLMFGFDFYKFKVIYAYNNI